ncbi:MAG: DUF1376 domain-containing protein [Bacteroidota bacterium]|nr:DUF1376 domain-containing protein [Bacteroidota bacterium]
MNSPAFLFYSKDWIADTADWDPESKGVYIDLLSHQHVNGSLPSDERKLARVARLSLDEFSRIWETIKYKFIIEGDHVVNHRLNQVIEENQQKALKNKINGCFAAKVKMLDLPFKRLNDLKKMFDYQIFESVSDEKIKDEVYRWVDQMVNQVDNQVDNQTDNNNADVNANANEDVNKNHSSKKFTPPTIDEFTEYFKANGYSPELAGRAFKGYEVAQWHDSEGKQIKNWKQKCQHVWFRPENKSNGSQSKQPDLFKQPKPLPAI